MQISDAQITKFTTKLDKVVEQATVTNDLNINGDLLGEVNRAGEIKVPKMEMQGLADYDRENGFTKGDVSLEWETRKLEYDRGREFSVDYLDDEESGLITSAQLMGEFARTKVVPEVDAIRFARLAQAAGTKVNAAITTPDEALEAVLAAEEHMESLGIELTDCILYLTAHVKSLLRKAQSWRITQGEGAADTRIDTFDGMKMVTAPNSRFYTKITLASTGEGGYAKAADGDAINFMVVSKSAAQAIQKHEKLRHFDPDTNQEKDAHKWQYRLHHDLIVLENAADLIYANVAGAVAVSSVTLSQKTMSLTVGAKKTVTATVAPDNATDKAVTFKSSDASKASVDAATGEVTAKTAGSANITATAGGVTSEACAVTVTAGE